jgi:hypothetical protein
MLVKDLEVMESIVAKNKNLYWDGWTVVSFYHSEKGRTSKDGALIKGKWAVTKRFVPDKGGWNIPDKVVVKDEQA